MEYAGIYRGLVVGPILHVVMWMRVFRLSRKIHQMRLEVSSGSKSLDAYPLGASEDFSKLSNGFGLGDFG